MLFACFVFFFKQKTAYEMRISDSSSDVCSSDLVGVDDRPGVSIGIIDRDLILGQAMLKDIILDTSEGECARGIEAERFEIPRDQFHRCNSAKIGRASCRERVCQYV